MLSVAPKNYRTDRGCCCKGNVQISLIKVLKFTYMFKMRVPKHFQELLTCFDIHAMFYQQANFYQLITLSWPCYSYNFFQLFSVGI